MSLSAVFTMPPTATDKILTCAALTIMVCCAIFYSAVLPRKCIITGTNTVQYTGVDGLLMQNLTVDIAALDSPDVTAYLSVFSCPMSRAAEMLRTMKMWQRNRTLACGVTAWRQRPDITFALNDGAAQVWHEPSAQSHPTNVDIPVEAAVGAAALLAWCIGIVFLRLFLVFKMRQIRTKKE